MNDRRRNDLRSTVRFDVEQAALLGLLPAPITAASALAPVTSEARARAH
jgi:hypothetical protein